MNYTNGRMAAEFSDWPLGGSRRGRCRFYVEKTKHGERVCRQTRNKADNGWSKPKRTTYGSAACIVEGSDGRVYAALKKPHAISIMQSNLQFCAREFGGYVRPRSDAQDPESIAYAELLACLEEAHR